MTGETTPLSRDGLLARLTSELLDRNLAPGTKLPSERQLAERFRISRPIVREVLRELQERGLVEIVHGRGSFVRQVNALDAARPVSALYRRSQATPRHLVEVRRMLEREAVALAAHRATEVDVAAIGRALRGFEDAPGLFERAQADIAFHTLIARASHNPVIEMTYGSIAGLVFELMLRSLADASVLAEGAPYHTTILTAITERDPDAASSAMDEHLMLAYRKYGDDLDESLDRLARRQIDEVGGSGVSIEGLVAAALSRYEQHEHEPLIGGLA